MRGTVIAGWGHKFDCEIPSGKHRKNSVIYLIHSISKTFSKFLKRSMTFSSTKI